MNQVFNVVGKQFSTGERFYTVIAVQKDFQDGTGLFLLYDHSNGDETFSSESVDIISQSLFKN